MKYSLVSLFLLALVSPLTAQQTGIDQSSELLVVPAGDKFLHWYGHADRSYFLQVSDANNPLSKWFWAPVIEGGNDEEISYEVDGTASKGFFRLLHTTLPQPPGVSLEDWDADDDRLNNWEEITSHGSNPLKSDTDDDGLPDDWEIAHGLNPLDNGTEDPDRGPDAPFNSQPGGFQSASAFSAPQSPLSNFQAFLAGVRAVPGATLTDKDGDLIQDGEDADPLSLAINWRKSPKPVYAAIPVPGWVSATHSFPVTLNNQNAVLTNRAIYQNGIWSPINGYFSAVGQGPALSYQFEIDGRLHPCHLGQCSVNSISDQGEIMGNGKILIDSVVETDPVTGQEVAYTPGSTPPFALIWRNPLLLPEIFGVPLGATLQGSLHAQSGLMHRDGTVLLAKRRPEDILVNNNGTLERWPNTANGGGVQISPVFFSPSPTYPAIGGSFAFRSYLSTGQGLETLSWIWPASGGPQSLYTVTRSAPGAPALNFQSSPTTIGTAPGGEACVNLSGQVLVGHSGRYYQVPALQGATKISPHGAALLPGTPGNPDIWFGGSYHSLSSCVSNPQALGTTLTVRDVNDNGSMLAIVNVNTASQRLVMLHPVETESKDRFLTGAFDTKNSLFQTSQVEFRNITTGENLGTYKLDGSGGTHIYPNQEGIFSEQELDGVVAGSIPPSSNKLVQDVVLWRDGTKVRFATTFASLGTIELRLTTSSGAAIATISHELQADANFSGLIDHLADRIDSISGPPVDPFTIMPEFNGIPDDDDGDPLPTVAGSPAAANLPPPQQAATSWTATTRNLLSKVLIPVRAAVDGINNSAEATYKISGGFVKGFVDGFCDGIKSDVAGIAELGVMALESATGDFTRAKAMYDGIKTLATMTSEERGTLFDAMLVKFVDKSTTSVPWDPAQMNQADEWGISAYISGYGGGFITEQALAVMAQVGIVTKAGQGMKLALGGTKLGQLTVAMCQGVRQFISASFLSVSIHVKVYGEKALRSVRVMIQEVATSTRNSKTLGEHFYEMMERLTPVKLTFQAVADEKSVIYKSADDWLKIGATGTTIECALAADLGANLTEHGMKGFLNLWKGALRDGATGHYMHHLKSVCTASGILDAPGLGKILEMFDSTSQSLFKFIPDAQDLSKWISPAGVIYGAGGREGHRIMHILTHTVPGWLGKPTHSVWNVARQEVFSLIDEAWALKGAAIKDGRYWIYVVDMSHRSAVGTASERFIRIVVEDVGGAPSSKIVSSYPQL